jgi:hypothetical protein
MNPHHRMTKLLTVCLTLIFAVGSQSSYLFGQTGQEWGQPENGLQLSLLSAHGSPASSTHSRFRVEIQNVGSNDLLLKLGGMLANGRKQYPNALSLLITNPEGKTIECGFPGPFAVGGWAGPFIVPLPAGASFVLPVDLENWTQSWTSCFAPLTYIPLNLAAGKYTLRARYTAEIQKDDGFAAGAGQIVASVPRASGAPASTGEIHWAGQILLPVWIGAATSNPLTFEMPPRPAGE